MRLSGSRRDTEELGGGRRRGGNDLKTVRTCEIIFKKFSVHIFSVD